LLIEYFTVLILTYYVQGEYIQTKFLTESMKDCDRLIRVIVEPVRIVHKDADAHCIVTDELSTNIIRPRARPKLEENN